VRWRLVGRGGFIYNIISASLMDSPIGKHGRPGNPYDWLWGPQSSNRLVTGDLDHELTDIEAGLLVACVAHVAHVALVAPTGEC
jgi:hypothetical protein